MSDITHGRVQWAVYPLAVMLLLTPLVSCVATKVITVFYIVCGLGTIIGHAAQTRAWPKPDKALGAILGTALIYGLASWFWSINPPDTLTKTLQLTAVFGIATFMMPVLSSFQKADLKMIGRAVITGFVLGLALFISELVLNYPLYNALHSDYARKVIDNKQSKPIVILAFWLLCAAPFLLLRARLSGRLVFVGLFAVLCAATFASTSSSAQYILVIAPILAAIIWILPVVWARVLSVLGVMSVTIGMGAISMAIYNAGYVLNPAVGSNVASRFEIWNQTAHRILERPILGWGFDSSSAMPHRNEMSLLDSNRFITHLHPHNAPLQLWCELGIMGLILVAALYGLFYIRSAGFKATAAARYAIFGWSVTFLYTLSIWGIWQTWFTIALTFMGLMIAFGAQAIEQERTQKML